MATEDLATFEAFPKIPRLKREICITEKIDGTNAQVIVLPDGRVLAASRTRFITPEDDNMGFAKWVMAHEVELRDGLGIGRHYGEWWGIGIQRRYGLSEKRFSLFNADRWTKNQPPSCCNVVPILYNGPWSQEAIELQLETLRSVGSIAAPWFMSPEGVVVYHRASKSLFKVLIDNDEAPKGING